MSTKDLRARTAEQRDRDRADCIAARRKAIYREMADTVNPTRYEQLRREIDRASRWETEPAVVATPKLVDLTRRHDTRMATLRKTAARLVRETIEDGEFKIRFAPRGWKVLFQFVPLRSERLPFRVIGPRDVDDGGEIRRGTRLDHVRDLTPPGLTIMGDDATGDDVAADR
jgi:hypothetical protein